MDSLPPELLARIAAFLPATADLRALRLVNRQYAAVASRPLFGLLRFSGQRQDQPPPWNFGPVQERAVPPGVPGRTRTVEFAGIPAAVDEVLGRAPARRARTFVFDPAYYREGFWPDYLMQLENEMHEPVDEVQFDSDDPDEDDWEAAINRVLEHRRARPEREAAVVGAAQATWNEKAAEQRLNEDAVVEALARLFRAMTTLDEIDVRPWSFDGCRLYPELETCISYAIDAQRRGSFPSTFFLEVLARALHEAGRHVKRLSVSEFFADHLHDTPATRHASTGLQRISLTMLHVEFMADEAPRFDVLVELFRRAQPTLRRLSIVAGGKWPQLPARGGHSLLKMLGEGDDETPLVFPRLEFIHLEGLILSSPPLMRFLRAQPGLESLEFRHIYLCTPDAGWPVLVEAFPPSLKNWKSMGPLGHEPINADGPTAYNWMTTWTPRELPLSSGWKAAWRNPETRFTRVS
ncbi:hypothetical protein SAMD00023353_7700250 [Rosellinia necatrix]|uniref:F-box domain-containing protein n=1 Tax=Rosellinia necatrix TaxID=77044 RepID=A0A1W2TUB3_ROSNE|nr:hypothetical protein SAMD00023353_7700250 [Rosellinia necatrix]